MSPSLSRPLNALALAAVLVACGGGPGRLTITEPTGGQVINAETTVVRGTAPANTEVVHDIAGGFDNQTLSDASGAWDMEVELDVGDNVLTFRLEDDPTHATQQQVLVVRER